MYSPEHLHGGWNVGGLLVNAFSFPDFLGDRKSWGRRNAVSCQLPKEKTLQAFDRPFSWFLADRSPVSKSLGNHFSFSYFCDCPRFPTSIIPVFSSPNSNIPAFLGKKDKESSFHPLPLFPGHQPTVEFWWPLEELSLGSSKRSLSPRDHTYHLSLASQDMKEIWESREMS